MKNIALCAGKPLIAYTIDEAKKSALLSRYIVSSDSQEVISVSEKYGADCPFVRPNYLSTDHATSANCLQHACLFCESQEGIIYDYVVELMCTNPFKDSDDIDACVRLLDNTGADSVIGISRVVEHHPARIKKFENGFINDFCIPELSSRRQDLKPKAYIRNGSIYAIKRDLLVNEAYRFGGQNSRGYLMRDDQAINIDSPQDLILASIMIEMRKDA